MDIHKLELLQIHPTQIPGEDSFTAKELDAVAVLFARTAKRILNNAPCEEDFKARNFAFNHVLKRFVRHLKSEEPSFDEDNFIKEVEKAIATT